MDSLIYLNDKQLYLTSNDSSVSDIIAGICKRTGLNQEEFYLTQNGKIIRDNKMCIQSNVYAYLRMNGGKGGFGSMLRAIGAQIEKTTNREACRDLSGRRLRDINEEKRLKAWLDKQKDQEAEAEEKKRKKLEKLMSVPKHEFKDSEYEAARSELTEKVSEAVEEGFKKASLKYLGLRSKRKLTGDGPQKTKKPALWIDDDLDGSSSTDSESDSDNDVNNSEGESSESLSNSSKHDSIKETTNSSNVSDSEAARSELTGKDLADAKFVESLGLKRIKGKTTNDEPQTTKKADDLDGSSSINDESNSGNDASNSCNVSNSESSSSSLLLKNNKSKDENNTESTNDSLPKK